MSGIFLRKLESGLLCTLTALNPNFAFSRANFKFVLTPKSAVKSAGKSDVYFSVKNHLYPCLSSQKQADLQREHNSKKLLSLSRFTHLIAQKNKL